MHSAGPASFVLVVDSVPSVAASPSKLIFLELGQVSHRLGILAAELSRVQARLSPIQNGDVDVFYRYADDTAFLLVRLAAAHATDGLLKTLALHVGHIGGALIPIGKLSARARQEFYRGTLASCTTRFFALPTLVDALDALRAPLDLAGDESDFGARAHAASVDTDQPALAARFLRGDRWQRARVRSLSQHNLALATACPPRRDDVATVELSLADVRVTLEVAVTAVTQDAAARTIGSMGFAARIVSVTAGGRAALLQLIHFANDQEPIAPPPARAFPRYPVSWPIDASAHGRAVRLCVLDLSVGGMFASCERELAPGTPLELCIPADNEDPPFLAHAVVKRTVSHLETPEHDVPAGVGLLLEFSREHRARYQEFVARVAHRATRHIVVGASPARLAMITDSLAALGYSATGAADTVSFLQKAAAPTRVPDLVLVDQSMEQGDPRAAEAVRRALAARNAPTLHFDANMFPAGRLADRTLFRDAA